MNREIKFRRFVKHSGKMIGAESIFELTDNRDEGTWGTSFNPNNVVFMQYIGLKDAEGCEIYEGDIVGYSAYHGMHPDGEQAWGGGVIVIEWDNARAAFKTPHSEVSGLPVSIPTDSIKVLGNIHENLELLAQGIGRDGEAVSASDRSPAKPDPVGDAPKTNPE